MTEDIKKVVEALRGCSDPNFKCEACPVHNPAKSCQNDLKAADLIEQLTAELEQAERERDGLSIMLTSATSAFETVKRERDAAIEDMRGRCYACANARPHEKYPNMHTCEHIRIRAAVAVGGYGKTKCDKWQWRGVCAENGGGADVDI